MKSIYLFCIVIISLAVFTYCSKHPASLVGEWTDSYHTLLLDEDGTGLQVAGNAMQPIIWTAGFTKIDINNIEDKPLWSCQYRTTGKTLILSDIPKKAQLFYGSKDNTLTLTKKQ